MNKIFVISDIHYGKLKKSSNHPSYIRISSENAEVEVKNISKYIPLSVDLSIQLGDLVRNSNDHAINEFNLVKIENALVKLNPNLITLGGNHDFEITHNNNADIFMTELDSIIVLIVNPNNLYKLNKNELNKINSLIKDTKKPILFFTHIPIFPIDNKDNFLFGTDSKQHFFNYEEVKSLINNNQKVFFVSGHFHWISSSEISDNIKQITLPSFSENIITTDFPNAHPCVYTIIESDKKMLKIKSYSREFCFGQLEYNL